ncbi:MAG: ATP-grasp domain-containing protein [Gammaproteobacteria bacterium]|nr:ATP-grasp domain-containing protein [Gammaproteobacteria bacterium]
MIKKFEFWHPRVFELPYYGCLAVQCLLNRITPRTLAKANYALDHGEIGLGSKLATQHQFDPSFFLPSDLILEQWNTTQKQKFIEQFGQQHGWPLILKSNVGSVGKGIVRVFNADDAARHAPRLLGDYIVQKFTPWSFECGIFYVRQNGVPKITGINRKHFPTVTGNGEDDLLTLAQRHYRYTEHWDSFLQELDTAVVLAKGEQKRLSFIGSHTLGCKFTDDMHLLTPQLAAKIFELCDSQPGFNFGRVDIKAEDQAALQRGEFVVIEVNGVASLPTHMFDPAHSIWKAYKIFFEHGRYLARIAREHRHQPMELASYREVVRRVGESQALLNKVHQRLMGRG